MKKILVVDDNRSLREIMSEALRRMGYDAVHTGTATEALQIAVSERLDAILLDIDLPDMDGRDAARKLRTHPATKNIRIIAFTGERSLGPTCVQAGCDDYVVKPVTYQALRERLRHLVR